LLEAFNRAAAAAWAKDILNQPLFNTVAGFKPDLDDYADDQTKNGVWKKTAESPNIRCCQCLAGI
jgi:hypothetical protein